MCWRCRKYGRRERWTQSKPIKKSCPRVLKGHFKEESGFCFEISFLKSTCVRILMLVAGGADVTADVRVLKSVSLFWWSLLSFFCGFVLHCLYLAQKVPVCACICKCGHPDIHWLSFVISDGYRNQKAVQNQLCQEELTEVRDLKKTVACRGFLRKWYDNLCDCKTQIHFSVWKTEWAKTDHFLYDGVLYIKKNVYIHTHRSTRIC